MMKWIAVLAAVLYACCLIVISGCQPYIGPAFYSVTTDVDGQGTVRPAGYADVQEGEIVVLTAEADDGWTFSHWRGEVDDTEQAETRLVVMHDQHVEAVFVQRLYAIDTEVTGRGHIALDGGPFRLGEQVQIAAEGEPGWVFSHWHGPVEDADAAQTELTVTETPRVEAVFTAERYTLQVDVEGRGVVEYDTVPVRYGEAIELRAAGEAGWEFSHWSGDLTGEENPVRITLKDETRVTAVFHSYDVLRQGDAGERVVRLQTLLRDLGFYPLEPSGHFGLQTLLAVKLAQQYFGLAVDGIAGAQTWSQLQSGEAEGGALYTVQPGDSLWQLARAWNMSIERIQAANNLGSGNLLRVGQRLQVPGQAAGSEVTDLHWSAADGRFDRGDYVIITDVETGLSFRIHRRGGTNHADVEPLTRADTEAMRTIYGGTWSWDRRAVIVHLDDQPAAGSINGYPHGGQDIHNNGFDGHFCLHFAGSRLHLNGQVDAVHQSYVAEAAQAYWPLGLNSQP